MYEIFQIQILKHSEAHVSSIRLALFLQSKFGDNIRILSNFLLFWRITIEQATAWHDMSMDQLVSPCRFNINLEKLARKDIPDEMSLAANLGKVIVSIRLPPQQRPKLVEQR